MPSKCNRNEFGSRGWVALGFSIFFHGLFALILYGFWLRTPHYSELGAGYVMVDLGGPGGGEPGGSGPLDPVGIKKISPSKKTSPKIQNGLGAVETIQTQSSVAGRGRGDGMGEGLGPGDGGNGGGAGQGSGGGGGDGSLSRYFQQVLARIEQKKQYPRLAQQNGEEGIVLVDLHIGRSGQLLGYQLRDSDSSQRLIQATLHTVEAAAPFPPLPEQYPKESLTLQVPVRYQLH
jgi:TonB family protein